MQRGQIGREALMMLLNGLWNDGKESDGPLLLRLCECRIKNQS
jgi:hypothetical protein